NEIMDMWDAGEIKVLSNRFVLREGIDRPSIYHLILACPVGSLKTYLQMVGRVIRWSPETADRVLITDHGGSCLKFGSPNMDRDWHEMFRMSEEQLVEQEKKADKEPPEEKPIVCPNCGTIRLKGP